MIFKIRGVPTLDTILWMSNTELSPEQATKLAHRKTAITHELLDRSPLLLLTPGVLDFLDELKRQEIPRTIATSQTPEAFAHLFEKLHLERWFDKRLLVCHDGSYPGKPAPDVYIRAAKRLHIEPADCLVVEDARSGIEAAYSAGVHSIVAIGRSEQLNDLRTLPGVVKTIHNFSELQVGELFA